MQRRQFLSGLPSLAAACGIFAVPTTATACLHPASLTDHLQQLRHLLPQVAPQSQPAHPATEALALVTEISSRLHRRLPVPPSLWQNLADAITRTEKCTAIHVSPDLAPIIAREINKLTS